MLFILYTSKTHDKGSIPQKIKIQEMQKLQHNAFFCPFKLSREYLAIRGGYHNDNDLFFIFSDHRPVLPAQARRILKKSLDTINIDSKLYNFHSQGNILAADPI